MNYGNKIANQTPRFRFNSGDPKPTCSCCNKLMNNPTRQCIFTIDNFNQKHTLIVYHYVNTPHFILETKSGRAAVYCSEYCMKKHNAKFTRK